MLIKDILLRLKDNKKTAVEFKGTSISYNELYCTVESNKYILKDLVKYTNNIGLYLPNSLSYVIGYFSIAFCDKTIIPIENSLKKDEIRSIISYCECRIIITTSDYLEMLENLLSKWEFKVTIFLLDNKKVFEFGGDSELPISEIIKNNTDENDVAIMLHTSGTTDEPKRVMLTHKNLIANIESNIDSLELNKNDISLIVLPMYFGYCNTSQFLTHMYLGAKIIICDGIFNPTYFLKLISEKHCTNTTCIPSMLFLIIAKKNKEYDISSLRYLCFGGGIMPVSKLKQILAYFNKTGVVQTYGQTEASPRITSLLPDDSFKKIGSVGKCIPNVKIDIFNEEDKPVERGQIGEIVVRGDNVMKGYYKHPIETDYVKRNGWLHTGDLGRMDDEGYLYIVGRIKNVIITGGLNIYPENIEKVLLSCPGVKEAVVYGEINDFYGEIPVAKVVVSNNLSIDKIKDYCKKNLDDNKMPRKIIICKKLNKTYNGKIKRER